MAKKKILAAPPDDIPAWFMTYSDVITLLMTFFILLLTFSTTEPERFEKVNQAVHSTGGATGLVGEPVDGLIKDSWVTRVRPPASRIATRGSEMPPLVSMPVKKTFGAGLKSLDHDQRKHNEANSHYFEIEVSKLFDSEGELTNWGKLICDQLANQLQSLPVNASVKFSDPQLSARLVKLLAYLFDVTQTRPGQVSLSLAAPAHFPPITFACKSFDLRRMRSEPERKETGIQTE